MQKAKNKRILSFLSLFLSLIIVLGSVTIPVFADGESAIENTIEVYVNLSQNGSLLTDKSGNTLALAPVTLSENAEYNLNDVFTAFHDLYYIDGRAGYSSANTSYGLSVEKFWNDTSGNLNYQINAGSVNVSGATQKVNDKDVIDVALNQNAFPYTENYTYFDKYRATICVGDELPLNLTYMYYGSDYSTQTAKCTDAKITINGTETEFTTNNNGDATLTFDKAGTYVVSAKKTKTLDENTVTAIQAPTCVVTVLDAAITVPDDATLFVGMRSDNYYKLSEIEPALIKNGNDTKTYCYDLKDKTQYNYRISGDGYITYGGSFKKTANFTMNITEEQLNPAGKTKTTVDRDSSSNNGYNVADIYLNINPQGYLKLATGENFQIVSHRNWQAVNTTTVNYFIEPDKHFSVTDINGNPTDIVSIDENGLLTAEKSGTAVVLVTYDAMVVNHGSSDDFYGAVYPENTGVFVVSVDAENSGIKMGITINNGKNDTGIKLDGNTLDSELDCIYYIGESGSYTFTPETGDVTVKVANPVIGNTLSYNGYTDVAKNIDGSYSVPLKSGRNILKLEKDGKAEYQIITAKKINITVNKGEEVYKGDTLSIAFDKLYHPVNKLAGIYNYWALPIYTNVSEYTDKIVGATGAQYNFANSEEAQTVSSILNISLKEAWGSTYIACEKEGDLIVPEDYDGDTFTLSGGAIFTYGYGFSFGDHLENHRSITYSDGVPVKRDYYAESMSGYFAKLPDIEIPVKTLPPIIDITADTENVKTEYTAGMEFDIKDLLITANYEGNISKTATNYTIEPKILTTDTTKVTVTYKGKTLEIPVTVTEPDVVGIEITTAPTTTVYEEGETFDPTGMVVSKICSNNTRVATTDYTYSPNRELTCEDTAMTISYTGENATDTVIPISQPITVNAKSSSGGNGTSNKIKVSFTLLGDEKHGTPESDDDTHTKKKGNLETWIAKTTITVDKGSYVIDALKKVLSLNGIPYTNEGNYISKIKGLEQFDNGDLSGWMYTLNGKYPTKGVDEQKLSDGDAIIFHYTDDYTKEKTTSSSSVSGITSSSKPSTSGSNNDSTTNSNKNDDVGESQNPTFTPETYNDVSADDWYYDSVKYAYENNLMQGTNNGFEPESKMTRAMLVTVLWRTENKPSVDFEIPFTDVESDQWYTEAIRWAASEKIVNGLSETLFGTDEEVTREQLATILCRYADFKGIDTNFDNVEVLSKFTDSDKVSDYAGSAMAWNVDNGIIQGFTDNTLAPASSATRAEAVTMLMRFYEVIK